MLWKNISLAYAAGCLGGLANSLTVWLFGALGISQALGVSLAPPLTRAWLYQRVVWGGLWGFLFLLPVKGLTYPARGLLFSLGPSLGQLLVVFPFQAQMGFFGFRLGYLTPALVLFFNAVWGVFAAYWLKITRES